MKKKLRKKDRHHNFVLGLTALLILFSVINCFCEEPIITYPRSDMSDKEELAVIYSTLEQMRLEHNRVGEMARVDWPEHQGKWAAYTKIFRAKQLVLLREQNRLEEKIRKANYTDKQWKELTLDERASADLIMYGDKEELKGQKTMAASASLDQIKAVDFFGLEGQFADPVEDFTTFTEDDSYNVVASTSSRMTVTNVGTDQEYHTYKSYGSGRFGDFEHLVTVYFDTINGNYEAAGIWAVANTHGTRDDLDAATDGIVVYEYNGRFYLAEYMEWQAEYWSGISEDTPYYLTIERSGSDVTLYIYTDSDRTSLSGTVALSSVSTTTFEYLQGAYSYGSSEGDDVDFYVENLDLQGGVISYQKGDGKGTVSETDDSTISSGSSNMGTDTTFLVDESSHYHSVIKFPNIFGDAGNQIPLGSTINSATLTLEVSDSGDDVNVYQLIEDWTETDVTWNSRTSSLSWTDSGADGTGSRYATAVATIDCSTTGTKSVTVTSTVQNWSDGEGNYGWVLTDTGTDGVDIYSSEYGTVASRPKLTVDFTPPGSTTDIETGLVGYWPLNENPAIHDTTVVDYSGKGHDGTLSTNDGSTNKSVSGQIDQAITFDGSDDYAYASDLTDGTDYDFSAGASFTIAAWIKPATNGSGQGIVIKEGSGGPNYAFEIALWGSDGQLGLNKGGGAADVDVLSSAGVSAGVWSHVAVVKDGTTITFYINGNSSPGDASWDNLGPTSQSLNIGQAGSYLYSSNFSGPIDEVRIYNRALTQADITELYNYSPDITTGLVGYWPLDENPAVQDTTVVDYSGQGNNGTLTTNDGSANKSVTGQIGQALVFDGSDDGVQLPDSADLMPLTFTISAWFRGDDVSPDTSQHVVALHYNDVAVQVRNSLLRGWGYDSAGVLVQGVTTLNDDTWYHVTFTYDGTAYRLYLNGFPENSVEAGISWEGGTHYPRIGINSNGSLPFDGMIDDVRIYNRALTQADITELYNYTAPADIETGLIAYWKLDENPAEHDTTIVDYSGQGNNGTLSTNDGSTNKSATGQIGQALTLDGSNDYISIPSLASTLGSTATMALWIKTDFESEGGTPGGNGWDWGALTATTGSDSSTDVYWGLIDYSGKIGIELAAGYDPQELLSANPINDSQWHHIVITRDSYTGAAQVFVDGDLSNSGTIETGDYTSYAMTWIGHGHPSYGEYVSGIIDDVRIYNRVLSQDDITELYNYTGTTTEISIVQTTKVEPGSGTTIPLVLDSQPSVDNLLVAFCGNSDYNEDRTVSAPDGTWTKIEDATFTNEQLTVWWKIVQSGDGTGYTFTVSGSDENHSGVLYEIQGADTTSPINQSDISTNTITSPTVTPTVIGTLALAALGTNDALDLTGVSSGWSIDEEARPTYHGTYGASRDALTTDTTTGIFNVFTISSPDSPISATVLITPSGSGSGETEAPSFITSETTSITTAATDHDITIPANQEGDLILVVISGTNSSTSPSPSYSVPDANWTEEFDEDCSATSAIRAYAAWRLAPAGGLSSPQTFTSSGDIGTQAIVLVYRGVHQTSPIYDSAIDTDVSNGDHTSPNIAGVTASNTVVIRTAHTDDDDAAAMSYPTGSYNQRGLEQNSSPTNGLSVGVIDAEQADPGDTGAVVWTSNEEGRAGTIVIQPPEAVAATTTIGDGTSPADKDAAQSSTNNAVNAFTLVTSTGTDTVEALTVTFTGSDVNDVAASGVKIYEDSGSEANEWDSGDTEKGSASFSGTTADVTVSISVDSTPTQYLVTYDIAAGATVTDTLQGAITAATVTNTLTNNDTTDATLTVTSGTPTTTIGDGTSPADKNVAQSSTNNAVNAFTLVTNTGTDTVEALTVTFTGSDVNDVAASGVKIYEDDGSEANEWDSGDTEKGSASFSGTTADVTVSISVDSTPTQYLVTYDIAAGATVTDTLQGAITAATVTNTLVNNDTTDATLTISSGDAVTTTAADGIWAGSQRYCHYANGYYWIVFYDGTNPVIFSSSDASMWFSQGDITADHTGEVEKGADIAVRFSGTTMLAVFTDATSGGTNGSDGYNDIFYRKATLNNDGTVTWWPTSTDHEVVNNGSDDEFVYAGFDSENKPWVGGADSGEEFLSVREGTALESPTWTLRETTTISATDGSNPPTAMFPVADTGDMYFIKTIYYSANKDLWGIGWDQSAAGWGSWSLIVDADLYGAEDQASRDAIGLRWSAVKTSNGEIHLVYIDSSGNINHKKGTDALSPVWSTISADITGETSHRRVTLAADGNFLYVFYDKNDNKIYYRKYNGSSWESEYTLKSDSTAIQGAISAYESSQNNKIGVVWVEGSASPYDVKFATIDTVGGCGYASWRQIAVDNTKVSGTSDLTDFPLLVSLSGDWLKTTTVDTTNGRIENDSGFDIIFKDTSGTQLDHEIEDYNGTNGTLVAWVRIPTLSYDTDTVIYMYYGNPCISTSQQNVGGVWDDNYMAVWHLSQTPDTDGGTNEVLDSNNSNHGDSQDMASGDQVSGRIDGSLTFDGSDKYVNIPHDTSIDFADESFSYSMWIKGDIADNTTQYGNRIFSKGTSSGGCGNGKRYELYVEGYDGADDIYFVIDDASSDTKTHLVASDYLDTTWHYITYTRNVATNEIKVYLDGNQDGATDTDETGDISNGCPFLLDAEASDDGGVIRSGRCFNGTLDEVRISNIVRPIEWIQTEFNNQNEPSTFSSVGEEGAGCSYSHSRKITVQNSQVIGTADHDNFPVLVNLTDTALRHIDSGGHVTNSNGYDIIFKASDETTQLDHEIEEYDGTNGTVVAWVRIPTLSHDTDTVIYMYYGNHCISTSQENVTGVWDSNYKGVWHLASTTTSGHELDSTSNDNHGLSAWNAEAEDFDDITDWTDDSQGTFTVEESPSGQLHLLSGDGSGTDSQAEVLKANMAYEGDSSYAIEFRVKFDTLANFTNRDNGIMVAGGNYRSGNDYVWVIEFFADRIHDYNNDAKIVDRTINTGQWYTYRLVVTDDDDVAIYEDGTYVTTANDIGFDYDMDDSYLVLTIYNYDASPVTTEAHFDWVRASTETTGFGAARTDGKIDGSLDFDGSGDYVEITNESDFDFASGDVSVSAWIYSKASQPDWAGLVSKYGSGTDAGWSLQFHDTEQAVFEWDNNDTYYDAVTNGSIPQDEWTYVVGELEGTTLKIYVNGALQDTTDQLEGRQTNNHPVWFAQEGEDNAHFQGTIDEVHISDTSRKIDWIQTEFNNQSNPSSFYDDDGEESAGTVTLGNHTAGQESDNFGSENSYSGVELFAFKLTNTTDSDVTVKNVQFQLSAVSGIVQGDFSNLYIYEDTDNDGTKDAEETTAVGGAGEVNSGVTTITFSDSFTIAANTAVNYILVGDVSNLGGPDTITIDLNPTNVTITAGHVGGTAPTSATHHSEAGCSYASWRQITVDNTKVSGSSDLTDFPLLVSLSVDWLKTTTVDTTNGRIENDSGFDIIFKDTSGTQLDHEIEDYNGTNGTLVAWVRIPTLSYDTDTVIYMYYGNPCINTSQENVAGVWDDNYAAVWHLSQTPDTDGGTDEILDSNNSNHGDSQNMTSGNQVSGRIDGSLSYDGSDEYVDIPDDNSLDVTNVTLSAWVKSDTTGRYIIAKDPPDIETLRPMAVGDETYIASCTESNHWDAVEEVTPDDLTSTVSTSGSSYERDLYNLTDSGVGAGTINKITVHIRTYWAGSATTNQNFEKICIKSGSTVDEHEFAHQADKTTWHDLSYDWTTNPDTSNPWTWEEINNLQAGVALEEGYSGGPAYAHCTQVYVEVDYTPAGGKSNVPYALSTVDGGQFMFINGGTTYDVTSTTNINDSAWHYIVGTFDGSATKIYIDGYSEDTNTDFSGTLATNDGNVRIGADYATTPDNYFAGTIAEVRISDIARDPDWILTEHSNQSDPANFYNVGEEGTGCSYSHKRKITIQASQVSGSSDHSNFPALVSLTDDSLKHIDSGGHVTNSNGFDIIFKASDETTQLDHELESYDGSTGTLVAWVRIPTLDHDDDTLIYMYYGNNCISTSQENVTGVWDSNYKGVWHLKETPTVDSNANDSTSNNNGSFQGSMTSGDQVSGKINGALDFDGTDDYVQALDSTSLDLTTATTLETWAKENAQTIIFKDGFESGGISNWTGTASGTPTVSSSQKYHGTYSLQVNEINEGVYKDFTAQSEIYVRGYIRTSSTPSSGIGWQFFYSMNGDNEIVDSGIKNDSGTLKPYIDYQYSTWDHVYGDPITWNTNTWYLFEFWVKVSSSAGEAKIWINGVEKLHATGINTGYFGNIDRIAANYWQEGGTEPTLYYDSIVFSDSYIGPDETSLSKGKDAYALELGAGESTLYGYVNNTEISNSVSSPTNWHHYALTYDGSDQKLYIDGGLANTSSLTGSIATNATNLKIGEYFPGTIDEVRISDTARDADWLQTEYNNQSTPSSFYDDNGEESAGTVTLGNHTAGQESDNFGSQSSYTGVELFVFKLTNTTDSDVTVKNVQFQLSAVSGIVQGDFLNLYIYVDSDNDGTKDAEETTAVGGAGEVNSGVTTITFSDNFTIAANTAVDYILVGDVSDLTWSDTVTIDLNPTNVTITAGHVGGTAPTSATHTSEAGCSYASWRQITVDNTKVIGTSDLTDFPLLVSLSGDWLKTTTVDVTNGRIENDSGYDIIFKDTSGTQLDHEIEDYDGTNGTLVAWVRIPTLSYDTDTVIYMYYGNPCISTSQENVTGVWNDHYKGVWHLNERTPRLVMVTSDGTYDNGYDGDKKTFFEGLGYTVSVIAAGDAQGTYDSAASSNDIMFITDTAGASPGTKAQGLDIAIVSEEIDTWKDLMYYSNSGTMSSNDTEFNITDNSHFITSPFSTGDLTVYSSTTMSDFWGTTLPSGADVLAEPSSSPTSYAIIAFEEGAAMGDPYTAPNRRVLVSTGSSDYNYWNPDLKTLLGRSLEWGAAGTIHYDSTSNANNGSGSGNVTATGKISNGHDFDGSDDYIEVGTTGWSASAGTVEAWINASELPPGDGLNNYVIGHTTQPSYADRIQLYLDEGETSLCLGLGDQHAGHINIIYPVVDTWYHVVFTWDGTNYEVFVDSVSKADGTYSGLSSIHTIADIGNTGEPTDRRESWDGIIDEVRISDIPRPTAWIQTEYNNQNDPSTFYGIGEEGAGCSYSHKRKITIQASEVSGTADHTDFPVLVNLTDDSLRHIDSGGHVTNSNGFDIIFKASDETTQLDHEIESYDGSTGTVVAWVRIPTLDHDDDTVIYMYYGNNCISTSQENVPGVWNANYKGVWHLSETKVGISETGSATNVGDSDSPNITHDLTINENDVVIAIVHHNRTSDNITDNNGAYAFVEELEEDNDSESSSYAIYSRVAGLSEPATYQWSVDTSDEWSVQIRVFSGVDTSSVWDVAPSASTRAYSSSGTTATAPTMTTSNDGAMGIVVVISDSAETFSNPTNGYGTEVEHGSGRAAASYIREWPTAGATGASSATLSADNDWLAHQFALKPAAFDSNAYDSTSNNNVGSMTNMISNNQVDGQINGSLDFDGTDDYIDVADSTSLEPANLTIEFWLKMSQRPYAMNSGSDVELIGKDDYDANEGYLIEFDAPTSSDDRLRFYVLGESGHDDLYYDTDGDLTLDEWHHVVVTYDRQDQILYIDGDEKYSEPATRSMEYGAQNLLIGNEPARTDYFGPGQFDEVRISGIARDADWIQTEYNNQNTPSSFYDDNGEESAGTVTLSNHTVGQEPDNFGDQPSYTGVELFTFKLTNTTDSDVTVKKVQFQLSAVTGILEGDFDNLYIYVDSDNDGTKDEGETTAVGGAGEVNSGVTTITFSDSFTIAANAAVDYILVGDVSNLQENDTVTIDLNPENVTITAGHVSGTAPTSATHTSDAQCIFLYRRPITIQAGQVSGTQDLTDFPVLISLSGTWLRTSSADHANGHVESDYGWDIIFRDSSGKEQLDHEIEDYNGSASGGTLVAWVRIPTLDYDDNTLIYMYYGNPCIDFSTENAAGVWDDNYVAVWHLSHTPDTDGGTNEILDSNNSNHGDSQNMASGNQVSGRINGSLSFNGSDNYVVVDDSVGLRPGNGSWTISAWAKPPDSDQANVLLSKRNNSTAEQYDFGIAGDLDGTTEGQELFGGLIESWGSTDRRSLSTADVSDGNWHHYVMVADKTADELKLYSDGNDLTKSTDNNGSWPTVDNTDELRIGAITEFGFYFAGGIDELRISNIVRDPDWIKTEYNNQNDPSTFYVVDGEDCPAPTAVDLISFTATGQDENVIVEWETAQEVDNLGFNLYRSSELGGTYSKLNSRLIPGLLSSVRGQQYSYVDSDVTRSVLYYYMLEDVDLSGTRTMHGPICVDWDGDGRPDDYIENPDDDTDNGEENPEVSIPDSEFEELDPGLSDWTPSGIGNSARWVKLSSFKAYEHDEGVALEWETSFEVDNVGFHVYRELDGKFYRITPDLVPGSVFSVGEGVELPAGQSYAYWDALTEQTGRELYWLDCLGIDGGRASFGPIEPEISGKPIPKGREARFKSIADYQVSKARVRKEISTLREELSAAPIRESKSRAIFYEVVPDNTPSEPRLPPSEEQWTISAQPAVKIYVKEDGWYRVGEPELVAAGLYPGVDPRYLQLYADGVEQSILVRGDEDGRFDPGDAVEFYGTGFNAIYTDAHVYWLVVGSRPGRRLDTPFTDIRIGPDKGTRLPRGLRGMRETLSFPYTVELKERTFYFAALKTGERENFFGSVISTEPVDQLLTLPNQAPSSPREPVLEVGVQGATEIQHQIKILFNYADVGDVIFSGQELLRAEIPISQGSLREGDNVVTLTSQAGSMDISLVDYVQMTYWHKYEADDDVLRLEAKGGEWLSIGGFSTSSIRVVDITDPVRILNVRGRVKSDGSNYALTFKVPMGGERTLLAFTEEKIKSPARIVANIASSWHETSQGADVIIVAHKDLLESVRPLKELREQQGMSVVLIDVEDLYDEFNFGSKSPWAVKIFLDRAYKYWNTQPRYLILVGDASYDPRDYLGYGEFDLMPTKFMDTEMLKTASDDWFVDFDGDESPEMAVGRLPAGSAEEATAIVAKIINYEDYASLMNDVLIVSDKNDFHNFEQASDKVVGLLPENMNVSKIYRGRSSTARTDLLNLLNQGQLLVNYYGHGSTRLWNGNILTYSDALNLTNSPNLPFFVSTTCLNGFFHDPYNESLAEGLLKAPLGGAVAVWTSSGLTDPEEQEPLNKELITLLFNGEGLTIGEAAMRAKQEVANRDILRTWILFGDPTLRLK